jgi:hypothetical protein
MGPRIGVCSNDIVINNSKLDASWRGCLNDQGLGSGIKKEGCAGSGGSHGGDGGYGGSESPDEDIKESCKAESSYPAPYYFGQEAKYEGSGGASGDY